MKYKILYREQQEFNEIEIDELDISLKLIKVIRTQDNPDIYHVVYVYKGLDEMMMAIRVPEKTKDIFDYIQRVCMDYHEKEQPFMVLAWGINESL